jgi:hypothetical protein
VLVPYSESDAEAGSQVEDAASSCCEVHLATRPKVNRALLPELNELELERAKQERDKYQTLYSLEKDAAAGDRLEAESAKRDLKHEQEQHMGTLKRLLEVRRCCFCASPALHLHLIRGHRVVCLPCICLLSGNDLCSAHDKTKLL